MGDKRQRLALQRGRNVQMEMGQSEVKKGLFGTLGAEVSNQQAVSVGVDMA